MDAKISSFQLDPIIGIDLGTTNSLVACVRNGHPEILRTREGQSLLPSIVSFAEGSTLVGFGAKKNKVRDARNTIFSIKRLIGRSFEDFTETARNFPYEIVPGEEGARVRAGDRIYSAVEVSAMILRELRLSAEKTLETPVRRAVITVPAYFNDSQRQATRTAGRLAGLDVLRIINEPTAASLAYGLNRKSQGLIAVYDLGGGTFDISILKLHEGVFEVLATNGDTALGGDDLDQEIARVAAREIFRETGLDCKGEASMKAALLEAAESLKIAFSEMQTADFKMDLGHGRHYRRCWNRDEFEGIVRPVLDRTREPCLNALKDAGIHLQDLTDVILVGGPTRLKIVQDTVRGIFGRDPNTSVHPDEVVAQGAAIQADILAGNNRDFLLLDVVPLSLGLETYGGLTSTLIPRNTKIPTVVRETFTTFVDQQTGVDIHVLQGERERAEDNRSLARFKLKGIRPQPAGLPRIEVTFLIDADGILQVSAKDLKTGNEQSIEVRPSYGLMDEEVERMLSSRVEGVEIDLAYRKWVEAKNEAEIVIRAAEKKLPDAYRVLPKSDAELISQRITVLRDALSTRNSQKILDATTALNQSTVRLAEILLKEAVLSSVDRPEGGQR